MTSTKLSLTDHGDVGQEWDDIFADLPELDLLEQKKDEIGTELAALMSYAGKNRSSMADGLHWQKSRVTKVLSGKENSTIKTMWEFCQGLGYDFDVVFRRPTEARANQPWQRSAKLAVQASVQYLHRPFESPTLSLQTAIEVAQDMLAGEAKDFYVSICSPKQASPVFRVEDSGNTSHLDLTLLMPGFVPTIAQLPLSK